MQVAQELNQSEIIKVLCDEGSLVELYVRVCKTQSQILFEPFINFGFVNVGNTHEEVLPIKNTGKATGTIQFQPCHGAVLTIEPKILKISPKNQAKIQNKIQSCRSGLFKCSILFQPQSILQRYNRYPCNFSIIRPFCRQCKRCSEFNI